MYAELMNDLPALDWYSPTLRDARYVEYVLLMHHDFTMMEADRLVNGMHYRYLDLALRLMEHVGAIHQTDELRKGFHIYRRTSTRFANLVTVCKPRNERGDFIDLSWRAAEYALMNSWRLPQWFTAEDLKAPERVELRYQALSNLNRACVVVQASPGYYKFVY